MSGAEKVIKTYRGIKIDGSDEVVEEIYFHYNWGWCGMHNGYFKAGVFNTTKATTSRGCDLDKREHDLSSGVQLFWVTK